MQLNQLKRNTKNKKSVQVGRGGKRGKTSGKGTKGQKARAGRKLRPEERDIIKKIPKLRGHGKNRAMSVKGNKISAIALNLDSIEKAFKDNETVNIESLLSKSIIKRRGGKLPGVKILGDGEITKKVNIEDVAISASAKEKILKVGGTVK